MHSFIRLLCVLSSRLYPHEPVKEACLAGLVLPHLVGRNSRLPMRRDGELILDWDGGGQQPQPFPARAQLFTDELTPIKTQANKEGTLTAEHSLQASPPDSKREQAAVCHQPPCRSVAPDVHPLMHLKAVVKGSQVLLLKYTVYWKVFPFYATLNFYTTISQRGILYFLGHDNFLTSSKQTNI